MMNEQEFVVRQFQKAFDEYRHIPFVLYGLGKNTEAILKNAEGFLFAGLMDAQNTGGVFWGLKVLDEEEVLKLKPQIVIIARESVVPVIYERIAHLQRDHGLRIYNFKGELLGKKKGYGNGDLPYWEVNEEKLKRAIDAYDYISFDVFDTLLMRRVLEPADVFRIVEAILIKRGCAENRFLEHRVRAERGLDGYPTLDRIYEEMGKLYHISGDVLQSCRQLEEEVEDKVIVPRKKMVELFRYALRQGKKVYLISDMYFPAKEMERFLKRCGVEGYHGLLVSCDYRKGKADGGLFEVYRQFVTEGGSCLHIGDNRRNDGERAREKGLDAFQIYSAYEMWMMSSMQTTLTHVETLEERCILGNLVWKCCENPFALHETKGVLAVREPEELGYLFLGALYDEFISWLLAELKEYSRVNNIEQLLLPARDGYFIERLLAQEEALPFEAVYFKASRRAVSVAAIRSAEDILLLAGRGFQGSYGELLWRRFGIRPREDDAKKDCEVKGEAVEKLQEYALSYESEILQHAEQERNAYLAYLEKLGLLNGKEQAIFDFVAGGTVQFFLQKLLGKRLKGFYFATMNHPNKEYCLEGDIVSAYGNICSYGSENQVAKHYLFLETIMVDGCPTLKCVEEGRFVYEPEEENHFDSMRRVQKGILAYRRDMRELRELRDLNQGGAEREFADRLFGRLFDGSCQVEPAVKKMFVNDDVFDGVTAYAVWGEA